MPAQQINQMRTDRQHFYTVLYWNSPIQVKQMSNNLKKQHQPLQDMFSPLEQQILLPA